MCGIAGIFEFRGRSYDLEKLTGKMCAVMVHRGPDDSGTYSCDGVALGHRRLSIIDLSPAGGQPMHNEDKTIWIVFNGEIYNYLELRELLIQQGHHFSSSSDTETIVHLYEEYGRDCVRRLNGMFAFALWDEARRELFLARDHVGIKPLYYCYDSERFLFASEIKAILQVPGVAREVDELSLDMYLGMRYVPAPRTMFKKIAKVLPGHLMIISKQGIKDEQYWDLTHNKSIVASAKEYATRFDALLNDSVKRQLVSDVPVGVFLSGGLDSSAVTAIAAEGAVIPVKTFGVIFDMAGELDESVYARRLARRYGCEHHEVRITFEDFLSCLGMFVWHMDEPVADPAAIPLFYVAALASKHVKVVLSGEGSDELFAGYWETGWALKGLERARLYRALPRGIRRRMIERLAYKLWDRDRVKRFIQLAEAPESMYSLLTLEEPVPARIREQLYVGQLRNVIAGRPQVETAIQYLLETDATEYVDQQLYLGIKAWLPDDLLVKADKMTMAHSLELRVPFLDHRIVEFAGSLPANLRIKKSLFGRYVTKPLLRTIMASRLPREIVWRRKWGFLNPSLPWLHLALRRLGNCVLLSQKAKERGLLNSFFIERMLNEAFANSRNYDRLLWHLFVFEVWCRIFLDGEDPKELGHRLQVDSVGV